ncbi:hypothetical protein ACEQ8H_004846 [Pleosporales sp. CAS-2024a]
MSTSSEPSSPAEPVWDMIKPTDVSQQSQPPLKTTYLERGPVMSHAPPPPPLGPRLASPPPKEARLASQQRALLPAEIYRPSTKAEPRSIETEQFEPPMEQPSSNSTAPFGKIASRMKMMLRRRSTTDKKKEKKEKDYYDPVEQSAFPTKTVVFFLVIGGLIYYFVQVDEPDWTDAVLDSYQDDRSHSTPLHFISDKEELDHYLQFHVPNAAAAMKEPGVAEFISGQFEKLAFGWMMTEAEAQRDAIPVTHGCRFRSNEPCEDFFSLGTSPGPGEQPWNYWSIYDGHAGRHCANVLQWTLIPYLSSTLLRLPAGSSSREIESTMKKTFLQVDKQIMDAARTAGSWFPAGNAAAVNALVPAFAGSCALLAAFDPKEDILRVACVGDSRAVLGRWNPTTRSYTSIPLSVDQTGFNEKEVARIMQEHPNEPDVINAKSGRLAGFAITRAFGDHRLKWDNEFVKEMQYKFWGTAPRPLNKTPPYMTAEPEITETDIVRVERGTGGKSDFMIMASDGLWDRISSEHAVECVERWLEAKARGGGSVAKDAQLPSGPPGFAANASRLEEGITVDAENGQEIDWKATPEFFAIEDENAAVCLARNAMGGTRRGLFTGVLSVPGPHCRKAVDDTTIMVVFFDKVGEQGADRAGTKRWWTPW